MIFYHQTSSENLDSILKQGLLCCKSNYWKASGGAIYLSNTLDANFGEHRLIIDLPDNWEVWQISDWEFWTKTDIPVKYIKTVDR